MSLVEVGTVTDDTKETPDVSLVMPCYNEEDCLEGTVPPLVEAFQRAGIALQLVLVDNGSTDQTGPIIDRLVSQGLPITKGVVDVNQGQGLGILTGFPLCRGKYTGYLCADGQVAPSDVVALYGIIQSRAVPTLVKVRRRYRQDSWLRKFVSVIYNVMMHLLFPGMPCRDVNGNPKILSSDVLKILKLTSRDWFLEAEVMLKARYLKLPVVEVDVAGLPREGGYSHVRVSTVIEFLKNIFSYRLGGPWRVWRRDAASMRDFIHAITIETA